MNPHAHVDFHSLTHTGVYFRCRVKTGENVHFVSSHYNLLSNRFQLIIIEASGG